MGKPKLVIIIFLMTSVLPSCSIRHMAFNSVANGLSGGGSDVFSSDDVPELVRDAVPFGLKLNEVVLKEVPDHQELLLATAGGFTGYAYAFCQLGADQIEDSNPSEATRLREQARKLYLRARGYAIRAIEVDHPGFMDELRKDHAAALKKTRKKDVPSLYGLGTSWAAAISISKSDLGMLSDLYLVAAVMERALELDPDYRNGALHEFFIAFDGSRPEAMGGSAARAREHFSKAVELTNGAKAAPYISLAENVSVSQQNVAEFRSLIKKALSIDPDGEPAYRLENILSQRRARWLEQRVGELFLTTDNMEKGDL